jgi:putative transposase
MIDSSQPKISINKQCQLLNISRSGYYYRPQSESEINLQLMRLMDEQHLKTPFYGSRKMTHHLQRLGHVVSRNKVRRLMKIMNIHVIYQKPNTSLKNQSHTIYPYLLRDKIITKPNEVWCTDITYIPMQKGFMYLIAIMDWYSKKVLSWRISNSLDVRFCIDALEEALKNHPKPEIFNTDQGSQFTSNEFTNLLKNNAIKISMDGKGRWVDNVFIERLWRSFKYECVYLHEMKTGLELKQKTKQWIDFYNYSRPHQHLKGATPNEMYSNKPNTYLHLITDFGKKKLAA